MNSELKYLKTQLQQIYPVLKQMKGEQQELRISSLKLGTSIKPAVREVAQQVNGLLLFSNVWLCDKVEGLYTLSKMTVNVRPWVWM